eukprot:4613496-Pyramimonas_sp.AAC.1
MIEDLPQDDRLALLSPESESYQEDVHAEILAQTVALERGPGSHDCVDNGAQLGDVPGEPHVAHDSAAAFS